MILLPWSKDASEMWSLKRCSTEYARLRLTFHSQLERAMLEYTHSLSLLSKSLKLKINVVYTSILYGKRMYFLSQALSSWIIDKNQERERESGDLMHIL